jgi:transcription initiation factor IIE alpha subunit
MTDMPEWRAWADRANKDLIIKNKKNKSLYKCSNCTHRSTKNQAKNNNWDCTHCGSPLKIKLT